MKIGFGDPAAPPGHLRAWVGLLQRSALVCYLAWLFGFALHLARQQRAQRQAETTAKPRGS